MKNSGNEIFSKIIEDAQKEANDIMETAQKSAKEIIKEQRSSALFNAKKVADSILNKAENDAHIISEKISTDIRNQSGWIILAEKERLIAQILNEVKNKLMIMQKSQDYSKVLEKLIIKGGTVLGGGVLEVLINKDDSKLYTFDKLSKDISEKTGVKTKLKLSENYINSPGVKIRTIDNQIYVDNTFEAIIRRREKELKLKISKILFKDLD
ncbi:hypothetical protein KJN74_06125 [Candidatus Bathyarchaeota archaeon]|nr:hypothetical protein [Candidatus Bathyarchaeota archaeon]